MNPLDLEKLSSPEERGNRLRILRNMSGLTIHEIADKHDIGASTIKYWECAKNEGLSEKGAIKFIEAMSKENIYCSFMWLMHGVGMHPQYLDARYGNVKKQVSAANTTLEEETSIHKEVSFFLNNATEAMTLVIYDDAMEPFYSLGDTIGGNRVYGDDIIHALGRDCIIETESKQILCRRFVRGGALNCYTLCCLNPQTTSHPPNIYDVKILSVAPIARVWKRLGKSSQSSSS